MSDDFNKNDINSTVFLPIERPIDNVMIIRIHIEFEAIHNDIHSIDHWNERIEVTWRTRRPISSQIREHIDMVVNDVQDWSVHRDVKNPRSLLVPAQRRRHC